ncbi:Putative receptor protein kinase ZmPK1 [Morus notabilis]|uniref:Receptor-like serine/threonine-protein kinase n=1 Tax=Morus notabilis TaxID=981085 RepID=W9RG28_9ROSA|nr:putative receptor protein kinase ZmPK1 [Morus notabilis]EXB89237.1 Putative receptor protein kinase ZmPK1 [Morus notabilis]
MDFRILFLLLPLLFQAPFSSSTNTLLPGSSLSVKSATSDVLVSPNGVFSAGFKAVGENAFCFAIWFAISSDPTIVWMANRDQPVNGRGSKLSLTKNGNLVLLDAGRVTLWSTGTRNISAVKLQLEDTGNLVLRTSEGGQSFTLWESFKSPTDTLLPQQKLTMDTDVVSSKSQTNYSSGYYKLYWDDDNVLHLLCHGPDRQLSSVYWPYPWLKYFENGRSTYNNSKTAVLNSFGVFSSSDDLFVLASDYGEKLHRRLTLDPDGNLRLYSFDMKKSTWVVTWQAFPKPCDIHGTCGPNSFCTYHHSFGQRCSCIHGFKMANHRDWFYGCEPEVKWNNSREIDGFFRVANAEFYGYDRGFFQNQTLKGCEEVCLNLTECKGFQFKFEDSVYKCYPKTQLLNGQRASNFNGDVYIRVPKANLSFYEKPGKEIELDCPSKSVILTTAYKKPHENATLMVLVWVSVGLAGMEFVCVAVVLCFLYLTRNGKDEKAQGYMLAATRFQEFTYADLRKATRGFCEEIGNGGGGTVFKGMLSDGRVAAIKRMREAHQGEAEFLAELSIIGRLNHMNLIEMWGYCAEGKHRLLVYEYMEHGSLADNLSADHALDWEKRFAIAMGSSKGLAYLHDECLEWVLHCDVKPDNILLDSDYQAKVADFGLSKIQNRGEAHNSSFSRIRGTRGYMAPEWVYNLPITSKVDVYSYGIVVLELVTGRKPTGVQIVIGGGGGTAEHGRLVTWVREKVNGASTTEAWIEEIADPILEGNFDRNEMEVLVKVALQCVEEDKEARPTIRQVVEMLQCHEDVRAITDVLIKPS